MKLKRVVWWTLLFSGGWTTSVCSAAALSLGELLGIAIQDYQFQEFDKARQEFHLVLRQEPANPYALHYLARVEYETGHYDRAIDLLDRQISTGMRFKGDLELLANACLKAGRLRRAESLAVTLLKQDPDNASHVFLHATVLEHRHRYRDALNEYERLFDVPEYADAAHFQAGMIYYRFQTFHKARHEFSSVAKDGSYGAVSAQYLAALAPLTKPLSVSASYRYFYNDNPGAVSSTQAKGAIPAVTTPSAGNTITMEVNSSNLDFGMHAHLQLAYSFYGVSYTDRVARSNDFSSHRIQATGSMVFSPSWKLTAVGGWQRNTLDRSYLNTLYSIMVSMDYMSESGRWHGYMNIGATLKRHNRSFGRRISTDMTYLDSDSPNMGVGGTYYFQNAAYIHGGYRFQIERTLRNISPVLNQKARDSYYREHALDVTLHFPVPGRVGLDVSGTYFYRSYQYPQSGLSLPSIKPGRYLRAIGKNLDVSLSWVVWTKANIILAAGYHRERVISDARELRYRQNAYYGQMSVRF